jgi:hypothetical protein
MGYTTKRTKMVHKWFDPMPYLIRCAPVHTLCGRPVQDIDGHRHGHPQNRPGTAMAFSMLPAMPMTIWFLLSMTPFYFDVYGAVRCC